MGGEGVKRKKDAREQNKISDVSFVCRIECKDVSPSLSQDGAVAKEERQFCTHTHTRTHTHTHTHTFTQSSAFCGRTLKLL